jgi:CubicO group peptidase (beta-lactamase class C family)
MALMHSARWSPLAVTVAAAVVAVSSLTPRLASQSKPAAPVFPGTTWAKWDRPEDVNYKPARLDAVRAWLRAGQTKALFVAVDGKELFSYGDVSAVSKVASVRKSVLAMLYGSYVAQGTIDLSKTVVELGLTDVQPFLEVEQSATLRHLLMARSGIYLPSGNEELTSLSPRRGSFSPGAYFQYQNWDFNAAGAAFESLTGKSIYDALESDLARPLGMQDFDRRRQTKVDNLPESRFPEYEMRLSARDMARLGHLMLRQGRWRDRQVIPAAWVKEITTLVTPVRDLHPGWLSSTAQSRRWGYGMLWWVWESDNIPGTTTGLYEGAFTAWGAFGQYITVIPVLDLVIAHTVDFEDAEREGRTIPEVSTYEYDAILQMLIAS